MKENEITNFFKIQEFHRVFGRTPDPDVPTVTCETSRLLRAKLIWEEMNELFAELGIGIEIKPNPDEPETFIFSPCISGKKKEVDLAKVAKELADLEYVVLGTAASMGINATKVFGLVHENNMSKKQPDGTVLRREDGKILKPDNFKSLNLTIDDLL